MKVSIGTQQLEMGSAELGELRNCNAPLGSAESLRARLDEDGYLLVRGLIHRDKVLAARRQVMEKLAADGQIQPGTDPMNGIAVPGSKGAYFGGKKAFTHTPELLAVLEGPELFEFYASLFGEPATTFGFKWLRAVGQGDFTGIHYDTVYMGRGSSRLRTCWVPFGDTPIEQGTLAICAGSHVLPGFDPLRETYGKMDVDRDSVKGDKTIGWFSNDPREILEKFGGQWQTTNFQAGDMITFGMHTMHASTNNVSGRLRLSSDVRFQPTADVMDARWVGEQPVGNPEGLARQAGELPGITMEQARKNWGV